MSPPNLGPVFSSAAYMCIWVVRPDRGHMFGKNGVFFSPACSKNVPKSCTPKYVKNTFLGLSINLPHFFPKRPNVLLSLVKQANCGHQTGLMTKYMYIFFYTVCQYIPTYITPSWWVRLAQKWHLPPLSCNKTPKFDTHRLGGCGPPWFLPWNSRGPMRTDANRICLKPWKC